MATNLSTLSVFLTADVSKFQKALSKSQRQLNKFANFAKVGTGIATAALTGFAIKSVRALGVQEDAIAQLDQTIKSTDFAAGFETKQLEAFAGELQKVTTFGDEAIIKAQALLATFTNIKGDNFKDATKTILDMSQALGQDLKSSTIQLGKALNDPVKGITALSRVGVSFTEQQKQAIKGLVAEGKTQEAQLVILTELQKEFGGQAERAATTTTGKLKQLSNAYGDLQEAVGAFVVDLFDISKASEDGVSSLESLTKTIKDNSKEWAFVIRSLYIDIKASFEQSYTFAKGILSDIGSIFSTAFKNITNGITWVYDNFIKVLKNLPQINFAFAKDLVNLWAGVGEQILNAVTLQDVDFTSILAGLGKNLEKAFADAGITKLKIENPDLKGVKKILDDIGKIEEKRIKDQTTLFENSMIKAGKKVDEERKKSFKKVDDDVKKKEEEKKKKDKPVFDTVDTPDIIGAVLKGTAEAERVKARNREQKHIQDNTGETAKNTSDLVKEMKTANQELKRRNVTLVPAWG